MTERFKEDGEVIPVTVVKADPCQVTAVRTLKKEKYLGVQLGRELKKKSYETNKSSENKAFRVLREFRTDKADEFKKGDTIDISIFKIGEKVKITGVSKGKGFQGVVKRHGFAGAPATHGHKDQARMPGSIGSGFPERVFKGKRMGGRMGGEKTTVKNLEIIEIDKENNLLKIKGALPGPKGSLLLISTI